MPANDDATRVLAEVEQKIDEFEQRLNAYMRDLGIDELNADELEALERAVPPNFDTWSLLMAVAFMSLMIATRTARSRTPRFPILARPRAAPAGVVITGTASPAPCAIGLTVVQRSRSPSGRRPARTLSVACDSLAYMGSAHSDQAEIVGSKMLSTPAGAEVIAKANEFRMDPRTQAVCEVLGQPFHGWTVGQLWDISGLLTLLFEGNVRLFPVSIGAEPVQDRFRAANRAALRAGLPEGCTAHVLGAERGVWRSVDDCDGFVAFPTGVKYRSWEPHGNEPLDLDLGAYGDLPLEIGHTDASRTYSHLVESGAVARWPYNHYVLAVLVEVPRWRLANKVANAIHGNYKSRAPAGTRPPDRAKHRHRIRPLDAGRPANVCRQATLPDRALRLTEKLGLQVQR